ncbi:MAG: threonine--tRNA ligase [Rickettsiales bacterium]|nr:threonine--tRNA ligase [Rickettsiales bacterium]
MVSITLPDGSHKEFDTAPTGLQVAESIGAGLAKAAIAMKVNGTQRDLSATLQNGDKIQLLTLRDEEGLEIMRHSVTAQVLAKAIKQLWPAAKLAIGPTIDDGFYYDVDLKESISIDDFAKIEAKMAEIIGTQAPVSREMWDRSEAIAMFEARGESYKAELIKGAAADDTTEAGKISLYRQGDDDDAFIDLCRGPHVTSLTKIAPAYKLTKVAGAYWRGDSKNKQLQRIYGTAWPTPKDLKKYLLRLEEANARDHRKLGKELDLFHLQEEATGIPFWHDKGWTVYRKIQEYMRGRLRIAGYQEVNTPMLVDRRLWEESGHWDKFRENMFTSESDEERTLAMKPMNCPCHVQIFNQGIKSYRDLPLRMAEFGTCHRNEPSGALHGLMRVRGFTQDDAHIFCTEDQITEETISFCNLLKSVYKDFGFEEVMVKFSDRPETRAGSDDVWDKAESSLRDAVEATGLDYTLNPGEGAFYGPKLEFVLRDAIGRDWQCGTLQVDFVLPERLDANYVGKDNDKHRPVMLHRAILGSLERFIGILIEEYSGKFPFWLAPTQVIVAPITNEVDDYAQEVTDKLNAVGISTQADLTSEKINYKVREYSNQKIPYIIAVGNREKDEKSVSIRTLGQQGQKVMSLDDAIGKFTGEAKPPSHN